MYFKSNAFKVGLIGAIIILFGSIVSFVADHLYDIPTITTLKNVATAVFALGIILLIIGSALHVGRRYSKR